MKRKIIFLVLVTILLVSCQSKPVPGPIKKNPDPAEETLRAYLDALEENDFDTALNYCTKETREVIEFYNVDLDQIRSWDKYPEIESIKRNSTRAVFWVKRPGYLQPILKFYLKKIGNDWLVDMKDEIEQMQLFLGYYSSSISPEFLNENYKIELKATPAVIHVFVALCDNKYQGIAKVSKKLGDGSNPDTNLY